MELEIDNWRWAGVPFYLRTGKGLAEKVSEITLKFRKVPFNVFKGTDMDLPKRDHLSIRIQPNEGITLALNAKKPGPGLELGRVTMDFDYATDFKGELSDSYELLLLEAMRGDHTLFLRQDGVERAWEVVEPILQRPSPIVFYERGSWGPAEADALSPVTKQPIGPDDLTPLFPMSLIGQEVSTEQWIDIPGPVIDVYRLWRPTPMFRATRLERALDTPARIYFKYEGVSPAGSHKPNTAVPQAYYNKEAGIRRIATETGAGQWGSAMAMASSFFGLECTVYMVRASYDQKPYRRVFMETFGSNVLASPSPTTNAGRGVLDAHPDSTGSLGIAISEAVEDAATHEDTNYALGSVLGHVLLHQSVIGLEAQRQMELAGEQPDVIVGCVGGGSNFAGISYPFMAEKLRGNSNTRFLATEPAACPTLTK